MSIRVVRYTPTHKGQWNAFVASAKNSHFLFNRDYMDYHADRFTDASRLFFEGDRLIAVLPANLRGDWLVTHGGLTFGGVITDERMSTQRMLTLFDALLEELRPHGITRLIYKAIPHIYHRIPAEEDLYALFRLGAKMVRRDVSSAIRPCARPPLTKGRKWAINQSQKHDLVVVRDHDFDTFMAIEEYVLRTRYGLKPVHTAAEMTLLASRFPDNIKLFAAYLNGVMHGGVIIYETTSVAHAQYISATDEGKLLNANDRVLDYLINEYYATKQWFDFGISTEQDGQYLNVGLIGNKESFGARAVTYDFYELDLT